MTRPYKRVSHNRIFGLENSIESYSMAAAALIITCMSKAILIKKPILYIIWDTSNSISFPHHQDPFISFHFLLKREEEQNINENPYEALHLYSPIIQSSSFVIAIWTQFVLSRSCRRISTPVYSLLILPASRPFLDVITQLRSFQPRLFC